MLLRCAKLPGNSRMPRGRQAANEDGWERSSNIYAQCAVLPHTHTHTLAEDVFEGQTPLRSQTCERRAREIVL